MTTETHIFYNRSNGYDRLNTATCGVRRLLKFYLGRACHGSDNETSLLSLLS
jgi:hypothetical protein